MSVVKMPSHYWQIDDVVPVFSEDGGTYEGKGRISMKLAGDDLYLIDWGDGSSSERVVDRFANRRYLARSRATSPPNTR